MYTHTVYIHRAHARTHTGSGSKSGFGSLSGAPLDISSCLRGRVDAGDPMAVLRAGPLRLCVCVYLSYHTTHNKSRAQSRKKIPSSKRQQWPEDQKRHRGRRPGPPPVSGGSSPFFRFWQPVSGVIDAFVDDLAAYKISHVFSEATALTHTRYPYYINYIHNTHALTQILALTLLHIHTLLTPNCVWVAGVRLRVSVLSSPLICNA